MLTLINHYCGRTEKENTSLDKSDNWIRFLKTLHKVFIIVLMLHHSCQLAMVSSDSHQSHRLPCLSASTRWLSMVSPDSHWSHWLPLLVCFYLPTCHGLSRLTPVSLTPPACLLPLANLSWPLHTHNGLTNPLACLLMPANTPKREHTRQWIQSISIVVSMFWIYFF